MGSPVDASSSDPNVVAVKGTQTGSGASGVWGDSKTGAGVSGTSISSVGVDAKTQSGPAALRAIHEGDGVGVLGACHGNGSSGVWGDSKTGAGVSGTSISSVGVDAKTQSGPAALRAIHEGDGVGVLGACHGNGSPVFGATAKPGPAFPAPASVRSASMPKLKAVRPRCEPSTKAMASEFLGPAMAMGPPVFGATVKPGPAFPAPASVRSASMPKLKAGPAALRAVHAGDGLAGLFGGDVRVTRNLIVEGDVQLAGADLAEEFGVTGSLATEPGSVVVLAGGDQVRVSDQPYDRRVAGIVSGAGNYRPGIVLDSQPRANRCSLALIGKVCCKVDADFGAIAVGDLLTTSATPGHAMAALDPAKAFGAVIGKALQPLREGRGLIPILVALQ